MSYFVLSHAQARQNAIRAIQQAPDGYIAMVKEPKRSLEQNAHQWPYLLGFSQQKELCINGVMQKATPEDWKDVLTACWESEMRIAQFDGKVILLPKRTSKMGKRVFGTWMDYLQAMAAQCGVEPVFVHPRGGFGDDGRAA